MGFPKTAGRKTFKPHASRQQKLTGQIEKEEVTTSSILFNCPGN
jgi:hypothetical protein